MADVHVFKQTCLLPNGIGLATFSRPGVVSGRNFTDDVCMGEKGSSLPSSHLTLRDQLVHNIYGMVDNEEEWPELLLRLDEYFAQGDADARDQDTTPLLAHMERANLLLEKLSDLRLQSRHTDMVLDRIPMGIVLINPQLDIVSINSRAGSLLDSIGAHHRDGRLQFADSGLQKGFRLAVERVVKGLAQGSPLSAEHLNLWVSRHGSGTSMQLVVYLGHRSSPSHIQYRHLMDHYGLTAKEAMLTARLCDGCNSLDEAADDMGIGIGTARSHLKRVFSKTGAQRQIDLVKLVLSNPILTLQHREAATPVVNSGHSRDSHLTHLPTGRTISWAEYGSPKGRPVLFCHAITGCRLLVPQDHGTLCDHGIRLIVPDRAGYGLSSPAGGNCMQQWLKDIDLFMTCIGIKSCPVIGHSAGGAFAMELAARHPERVGNLTLLGSVVPLSNRADVKHLLLINRVLVLLARRSPVAARSFLSLSLRALLKNPGSYFGQINKHIARLDSQVLEDTALQTLLSGSFRETTRQGTRQMCDDLMHLACRWSTDPDAINCPVTLWHGREDRLTPPKLVEKFSRQLGSKASLQWVDDAGYFLHFHQWPQIIKGLRT